jgi:predicted transcriptional regulator
LERLQRALSIRQPLLEAILTGQKTWEFRSRVTHIRERVYLYASKAVVPQTVYGFKQTDSLNLPRGVIVGSVEIIGTLFDPEDGVWGWELARPKRYRTPLKPKGIRQPGFWHPKF